MVYKVSNPDALKGMVIPERRYWVEKRDNEEFYRPIYCFWASEAVVKKEASRTVLRMLLSRVKEEQNRTNLIHDIPRERFKELLNGVRQQLAQQGDDGYSEIYELVIKPGEDDRIPVLGFSEEIQKTEQEGETTERLVVIPIDEQLVGFITGRLVPILDSETGEPLRAVCGQDSILRQPEDEDFGRKVRLNKFGNGIRLDMFMTLGKDHIEFPLHEDTKLKTNFHVNLYHVIEKLPEVERAYSYGGGDDY